MILAIRDYLILGLVHSLRTTLDHWKKSEIQKNNNNNNNKYTSFFADIFCEMHLRIVKEWSHQSDWHRKAFRSSAVRPIITEINKPIKNEIKK